MKLFAGSALILAAAAGFAQQMPDKKVTLDIPAGPVNKALDIISKEINVPLLVDRSMQKDIVVAHVSDCPASELMTKLADAVAGRWSQEGQGWRLLPDAAKRNAQIKFEVDLRSKIILDSLREMEKAPDFGKRKPGPEELKQSQEAYQVSRARASLIRSLGINNLAAILPGGRIVYSTRATAMQKPLSVSPETIALFTNYHNKYEVFEGQDDPSLDDIPPGMSAEMIEMLKFMQDRFRRKSEKITAAPAKVLIVAENSASSAFAALGQGVQVKLRAYDQSGKVILEEDLLNGGFGMFRAEAISASPDEEVEPPTTQDEPPVKEDKTPKIPFSERAKLLLKNRFGGMGYFGDPENMTAATEKLTPYFLKPYEIDPLELVHGEALRTYAGMKKSNFVACLPDTMLMENELDENTTIQVLDDMLADKDTFATTVTDGWIVASPSEGESARRKRLDRISLQSVLASAQGKQELPLDEVANFAFNNPNAFESQLLMIYVPFGLKSLVVSSVFEPVNWNMMRFYGSLPQTQRNVARQGGRIGIGELGPDARAALQLMVFGSTSVSFDSGPVVEPPAIVKDNPILERMLGGSFLMANQMHSTFLDEPTEFLPNGLNNSGFIQVRANQSAALSPVDAKGKTNPLVSSLDVSELSFVQMMTSMSPDSWTPDLSRFIVGTRTKMEFTFNLRPDVRFKQTLQDDNYPDKKIYVSGQLPYGLDKTIEEKKEKMKSLTTIFGGLGGFGGGNIKPPTY